MSGGHPLRLEDIHIIGVDPGKVTGLARLFRGKLTTVAVPAIEVRSVIIPWLADTVPAVVGCERFVITTETAKHTAQHHALEVTGVVRSEVERDGRHVILDQNMSDSKRFASRELRVALGWIAHGSGARHCNDAVCQLVRALYLKYPRVFHEIVTPDIV
jgi:hypothetical protein